jgi:hypothetical protein
MPNMPIFIYEEHVVCETLSSPSFWWFYVMLNLSIFLFLSWIDGCLTGMCRHEKCFQSHHPGSTTRYARLGSPSPRNSYLLATYGLPTIQS